MGQIQSLRQAYIHLRADRIPNIELNSNEMGDVFHCLKVTANKEKVS